MWNFDPIFEGSLDEQEWKLAHFVSGIRRNLALAEERLASAIFDHDGEWLVHEIYIKLGRIRACGESLDKDPRTAKVREHGRARQAREAQDKADTLLAVIRGALHPEEVKS